MRAGLSSTPVSRARRLREPTFPVVAPRNHCANKRNTMRIAIAGADGRMGRMLIESVLQSPDLQLTVALDRSGSNAIGQDAGAFLGVDTGVPISDDLDRSEEHTSALQSLMRLSYAVFCLKKKTTH